MFSRAITRRTLTGSGNALQEGVRRQAQAFAEADARFPPEQLARACDVRPRIADVAGALRLLVALDGAAEQCADRLCELVHGRGRACGHVHDLAADAVGSGSEQVRLDDVGDVREVASLLAVPVDRYRAPVRDRSDEARYGGRVLRRRILIRT